MQDDQERIKVIEECKSQISRLRLSECFTSSDREDLYQDVIVALFVSKAEITKASVMRIARCKRVDMIRRNHIRRHEPLGGQGEPFYEPLDPVSLSAIEESRQDLKGQLDRLTPENRQAVLALVDSEDPDRVKAVRLGIPRETFLSRRRAGLETLRRNVRNPFP